jgi:hypothetical protein
MTHIVGTYSLEDLLKQRFVPATEFGLDAIAAAIQARLNWLNGQVAEQLAVFAESSSDVRRIWGGSEGMSMKEVDELGVARTQKDQNGVEVDFPLRKFSISTGYTADYIARATPRDIAQKALDVQTAYQERLRNELAFAIFSKENYTFKDWLGDNTDLAVKAFLNADGAAIPSAPDGTTFAGASHQHYSGTVGASLAVADIDNLLANVTEHGNRSVSLFINAANVATLAGLASTKFVALTLAVVAVPGRTTGTVATATVEDDAANKLVGYWAGYPVYTRSWVPSGFYAAIALNAPEKPLVHRLDSVASLNGLRLVATYGMHPLTAQTWEAEIGFGAWNRAAVALLDGAHQTTYSEPSGLVR